MNQDENYRESGVYKLIHEHFEIVFNEVSE